MFFYLLMLFTFSHAYGGSSCPERAGIYPCICLDKQVGKRKFETMVICQGMEYGGTLKFIDTELSSMEIDKFLVYDSFWSDNQRMIQINERLPTNYMSTFRTKEVKVVDSTLSTFSCPHTEYCRTDHLKRFTAINSTVTDNPNCTSIYSWISCPETIEFVKIVGAYTINHTLKPDFFPDSLARLKALHLPHNRITRIDRRTFTNTRFPMLEVLDLSHNLLRDIVTPFVSQLKVKHLDLSYNVIRNMVEFNFFPELQYLNLSNNHILSLLQNSWISIPEKLRTIDLTKNNIECNCGHKWMNSTFPVHTNLMGHCVSPPEVAYIKFRKASRLLSLRCNDDGSISPSQLRTSTPSPQH